jgi:NTE family protein
MRWIAAFIAPVLLCTCSSGLARDADCVSEPAAPPPVAIVPPNVRIGIALGSGSVHGLAHIGVLEELEARKVDVDVVAGTSVGAIVGSLWASGVPAAKIAALARAGRWENRFTGSFLSLMGGGDFVREEVGPPLGKRPIEEWPRRFGAVATNLANGHERVLMSGDGMIAVQASSAVPMASKPVVIAGERLVDGALVQPVPVAAARAMGADYVIAIDVAYRPYEEAPRGFAAEAFQATHILVNSLAERQVREADYGMRLDLHEHMMRCGTDGLIAAGREAMRRAWPQIERSLAQPRRR